MFDSSVERGQPFTFTLGVGQVKIHLILFGPFCRFILIHVVPLCIRLQVIKGWDQGLLGTCVGEKRRLVIPSDLAYGKNGAGDTIPPDSTLIFETELIKIERKDEL